MVATITNIVDFFKSDGFEVDSSVKTTYPTMSFQWIKNESGEIQKYETRGYRLVPTTEEMKTRYKDTSIASHTYVQNGDLILAMIPSNDIKSVHNMLERERVEQSTEKQKDDLNKIKNVKKGLDVKEDW